MSDTKISEAAVEAAWTARAYCIASSETPRPDWMRAALEAAIPHLHPQPAELVEQQGVREKFEAWAAENQLNLSRYVDMGDVFCDERTKTAFAAWQAALAATGKQQVGDALMDAVRKHGHNMTNYEIRQQVGDDGLPLVSVTQEFKDQADYDAEISSAASNLLRNNTLGLSGSLPEMVAALLKLASGQQVGEVQGDRLQGPGEIGVGTYAGGQFKCANDTRSRVEDLEPCHIVRYVREDLAARQPGAQVPVVWANGCNRTVPEALRFLASYPRPSGGEDRFNSLHLLQLAGEIEGMVSRPLYAAPPAQGTDLGQLRPLIARSLAEWHEDDGNVMWWAWCGRGWAGEPAWCGTPNDSDWPGYHTHWTQHPGQPALIDQRDAAPGVGNG